MKVNGNQKLNTIFKIMGLFSVVTLTIGLGIGYYVRDFLVEMDTDKKIVSTEKAIKATTDNKEYLNKVFEPRLIIANSKFPTAGYYKIQNMTSTSVYLEKAVINVYGSDEELIYTTTLNLYKLYEPGIIDYLKFQIPQNAIDITRIKLELI